MQLISPLESLKSTDFLWPTVRKKWVEVQDFFQYSKQHQPDALRLNAWRESWSNPEKMTLITYYPALHGKSPATHLISYYKTFLQHLFDKYLAGLRDKKIESIMKESFFLLHSWICALVVIDNSENVLEEIFIKYEYRINHKNLPLILPSLFNKISMVLADKLIERHVKECAHVFIREQRGAVINYLQQGLFSKEHEKLFESQTLIARKKETKKKASSCKMPVLTKLIPSWIITAYITGYYDNSAITIEENKHIKAVPRQDMHQRLTDYIKQEQRGTLEHFKRLIHALYAENLSQTLLHSVGLENIAGNTRGLRLSDLSIINAFYEQWKEASDFSDEDLTPYDLLSCKIRCYLEYHGFDVSLSVTEGLCVASKAIKNLPQLRFSAHDIPGVDNHDFITALSSVASNGWSFLQEHAGTIAKVAVTTALILVGEDDQQIEQAGMTVSGMLAGTGQSKNRTTEKDLQHCDTIEDMIVNHLAIYIRALIKEHLENTSPQIVQDSTDSQLLPWFLKAQKYIQDVSIEYHYKLVVSEEWHANNGIVTEEKVLQYLAVGLNTQISWADRLLRSFDIEPREIEEARMKMLKGLLVRTTRYRISLEQFPLWRQRAHECWNSLAIPYIQEWAQDAKYRLILPHCRTFINVSDAVLQPIKDFISRRKVINPNDFFCVFFHPDIARDLIALGVTPRLAQKNLNWLELLLAYDCTHSIQSYFNQQAFKVSPMSAVYCGLIADEKNDADDNNESIIDWERVFWICLKYDYSATDLPGVQSYLKQWGSHDIEQNRLIVLAQNTTAQQFEKTFHKIYSTPTPRARTSAEKLNHNLEDKFFQRWGEVLPSRRDQKKLLVILPYASNLTYSALRYLIKYCDDKTLVAFLNKNLINMTTLQQSLHRIRAFAHITVDTESIGHGLMSCAYNYGLEDFGNQLMKMLGLNNPRDENFYTYCYVLQALSSPQSLTIREGLRANNIHPAQIQLLPYNYLRVLLMHSSRKALPSLAQIILNAPQVKSTPFSLSVYYHLIKNSMTSNALPYFKQKYWQIIIENTPKLDLAALYLSCYSKKICLISLMLNLHAEKTYHYRARNKTSDTLVSRLLEEILSLRAENVFLMPTKDESLLSKVRLYIWMNRAKKHVLSLEILESVIQRKLLKSINFLIGHHRASVMKNQWLPLYDEKKIIAHKTDYYRSFEEYMILLLRHRVFFDNIHKNIDFLYQYWKKIAYSPSLYFLKNALLQLSSSSEKAAMIKVVLKLSFLYDNNPKRRYKLWSYALTFKETLDIRIQKMTLHQWMKRHSPFEIARAYVKYLPEKKRQELLHTFPLEIDSINSTACLPVSLTRSIRLFWPANPEMLSGYHMIFLRAYVMQYYQPHFSNPSLAVRQQVRQNLSDLMRVWITMSFGADLRTMRHAVKQRQKNNTLDDREKLFKLREIESRLLQKNTELLLRHNLLLTEDRDMIEVSTNDSFEQEPSLLESETPYFLLRQKIRYKASIDNAPVCYNSSSDIKKRETSYREIGIQTMSEQEAGTFEEKEDKSHQTMIFSRQDITAADISTQLSKSCATTL